jgi:TonB family protein
MKTLRRFLFFIGSVFSVAVRLSGADVPAPPAWPEIKDPVAFIKVAREIIGRELGKNPQLSDRFTMQVEESRFGFSGPTMVSVARSGVLIVFLDLPFTGRAYMIVPNLVSLPSMAGVRIEETGTPEIKRAWVGLVELAQHRASIEVRDFKNLDSENASAPQAKVTPWPAYPPDALRAGIDGKVEARVSVKADGSVGEIETKGANEEFNKTVREALRQWRFIPAVEQARRIPVTTWISVTFVFTIHFE